MNPRILIIDDEVDILEFQKSYLSRRKYQVLTASNTPQAIEAVKNGSPDLVFCDLRLETNTSGLNIIEEIKKIKPEIVVYLITGIVDRDIEEEAISLGAKEVLHKPMTNEALEDKIKEAIG